MLASVFLAPLAAGATSEVPEPATYVLIGAGLVGLAYAHRRKRH